MTEEDYGKLPADQKKAADRALRAIPRTLEDIGSVTTDAPVADKSGAISIVTTVNFKEGFSGEETKKINAWWG